MSIHINPAEGETSNDVVSPEVTEEVSVEEEAVPDMIEDSVSPEEDLV
jgi:hypothetical protein